MSHDLRSPIKDVAVYLRKSRAEETEKDLEKHRILLTDICKEKNWKYQTYEEVACSASIDARPEMVRLLKDVEDELYDAVLVIDQDRLGRGDGKDAARIKEAFELSNTLILIRDMALDMSNDQDSFVYDINAIFANWEYKMIVKRFRRGKAAGARLGRWTNGIAPFPYVYDRDKQELRIDKDDYKLYRWILENYINNTMSSNDIAYSLNKSRTLTRKGKHWTNKTLLDLLKDETHLGLIVKGKTRKVYSKEKGRRIEVKRPKDEWDYYDGLHAAVKTKEEHEAVMRRVTESTLLPNKKGYNTAKIYPLSKLVKCGKCGCTLRLHQRGENNAVTILKCWNKDKLGHKCTNRASGIDVILDEINQRIISHIHNIEYEVATVAEKRKIEIDGQLVLFRTQLISNKATLERIYKAFEDGTYDGDEFQKRRLSAKSELDATTAIVDALKMERLSLDTELSPEKLNIIQSFEEVIADKSLSYAELNDLYRSIIKEIRYIRDADDRITLTIEYK